MKLIVHRGPDGEGKAQIENQALFGHRRLAIIDLEHGQQPMVSEDNRYTLIFNGEIYNYLELRQLLIQKGVSFRTFSDTEVLLQMLIQFGVEALKKLNGMFAFIFHDRNENQWIAARDPFGIKPLYFYEDDGYLYFASEIKCFWELTILKLEEMKKHFISIWLFKCVWMMRPCLKVLEKLCPGIIYREMDQKFNRTCAFGILIIL